MVADLATGEVLAAKSAHEQLPPASTLKVLTALALLPALDKEQVVVGTDEEMIVEGSKVGIATGLSYTVDLLFKAMLIDSGNDATQALARVNGGVERTVASMNALALELQALDTVAVNPSGLDEPGQVTSAYDLALIARAALEREDFRTYATTPTADLPTQDGTTYQIQNGNRLARRVRRPDRREERLHHAGPAHVRRRRRARRPRVPGDGHADRGPRRGGCRRAARLGVRQRRRGRAGRCTGRAELTPVVSAAPEAPRQVAGVGRRLGCGDAARLSGPDGGERRRARRDGDGRPGRRRAGRCGRRPQDPRGSPRARCAGSGCAEARPPQRSHAARRRA